MPLRWSYGVTTVPRRKELLRQTLKSLATAGFDRPRLFVDGVSLAEAVHIQDQLGLDVTPRNPRIGTYLNWIFALAELYGREPACHRYAVFQDDFVTCKNLRTYLEQWFPERGYQNLYTVKDNMMLRPSPDFAGWHPSNQWGRGALALIFDRDGVQRILHHVHVIRKAAAVANPTRNIDGAVSEAMKLNRCTCAKDGAPYHEYVHSPSLVQHTGQHTTMPPGAPPEFNLSHNFCGEDRDAMTFWKG